jgi:hypothetical protein
VGKLRQDMDYWDAVQRYEKARNQLSSERVDMIMGMHGDRSRRFCSVGSVLNDEVDRMHRAWLKLRPHLTMIRGRVRWGSNLHQSHQLDFGQFVEYCKRFEAKQKEKSKKDKITIRRPHLFMLDPDRPEFLGGPDAF